MDERDTTRQMEDTADEAREQAWETASDTDADKGEGAGMKEHARDLRDRVASNARSLAEQAREQVSGQAHHLRDRGQSLIDGQKGRAAEEVSHLSSAIRSAADRLREEQDETIARYADTIADQLDGAANYLRDRDLMGLFHDAQGFARRRPELVLGGMFVAGIAIARFLKVGASDSGRDRGVSMPRGRNFAGDTYGARDEYGSHSGYRGPSTGLAGGLEHVERPATTSSAVDADITSSSDLASGPSTPGAPSIQP